MTTEKDEKNLLPHHEQQSLCTTRLPYRQGRKLTAVKVYTVNNESNHLLIFGVPSLNLRQEAKALFSKFGKLLQFYLTKHATEPFTESYHAAYESIQMARVAKRMLDTKNFYGGSLHVCYAPELETVEETRQKLLKRQGDVVYRLRNLQKDPEKTSKKPSLEIENVEKEVSSTKVNMGEVNTITIGNEVDYNYKNKRKMNRENVVIEKKFKPCFVDTKDSKKETETCTSEIEIIDCTSVETETLTNINESLNYNTFGNEIIRKIPEKPVNKIKFHVGNKNNLIYF